MFWIFWDHYLNQKPSEAPTEAAIAEAPPPPPSAAKQKAPSVDRDEKYQYLAQAGDQALAILSLGEGALYISPNWVKISGLTLDLCMHKRFWNNVHADHRSRLKDKLRNVAKPKRDLDMRAKCQIKHADKSWHWYEMTIAAAQAGKNERMEYVCILKNITKEVKAEKVVQKAKLDAELALKGRSEFLANMSHELRTPLNAILGFSQIMHEEIFGEINNQKYKDYLESIQESGQSLLEKINDLIEISRIDTGKMSLSEDNIDLVEVIQHAIEIHSHEGFAKQIRIEQDVPRMPLWVRGDRIKLKHALSNLLANAFRHNHHGGIVRVSCKLTEDHDITITVQDTGKGIAPKKLKSITDALEQDNSFFARETNGLGLGLAMAKEYVMLHQGYISIASRQGNGTRATINLPHARLVELPKPERNPLDYISFLPQSVYN